MHSRERVEVHCDNKTAVLSDFKRLKLATAKNTKCIRKWISADMGHSAQSSALISAILNNKNNMIDTEGYLESSRVAILANNQLQT